MEVKDLQAEQELIDIPLVFDEDGEPTDGFKAVGSDSDEYQEADRRWKVKSVRKSAHRGHAIEAATETGAQELVSAVERREFAICAACIKEIYGFTKNGEPAPLNEATLKEIFERRPTWRTKVIREIEADRVFTRPSSAAGAP